MLDNVRSIGETRMGIDSEYYKEKTKETIKLRQLEYCLCLRMSYRILMIRNYHHRLTRLLHMHMTCRLFSGSLTEKIIC